MDNWKKLKINNTKYLITTFNCKNQWKIMLTDFRKLFTEVLTKEQIINNCQALNPLLSSDDFDFESTVAYLFENPLDYMTEESSTSRLEFRKKIAGGIFKFAVNLKTCEDTNEFFGIITRPLCMAIVQMKRENELLVNSIIKKDKEIQEFQVFNNFDLCSNSRTDKFNRSDLPTAVGNYDEELFFKKFIEFFDDNEGLFRKIYVPADENKHETLENKIPPEMNESSGSSDNKKNPIKNLTVETSNADTKITENSTTEKEKPKKNTRNSKKFEADKRMKKSLKDFIL